MRFGDPFELQNLLENTEIRTLDVRLTLPGTVADLAALHMKETVGMMLKGIDVSEQRLVEIRNAVAEAMKKYDVEGEILVPVKIHIVTALAT